MFSKRQRSSSTRQASAAAGFLISVVLLVTPSSFVGAQDTSAPAILELFDARWVTTQDRMIDIFQAGYGAMWLPSPGRADSGNGSVGYDVYDRFDLGKPRNQTQYGTQATLSNLKQP